MGQWGNGENTQRLCDYVRKHAGAAGHDPQARKEICVLNPSCVNVLKHRSHITCPHPELPLAGIGWMGVLSSI